MFKTLFFNGYKFCSTSQAKTIQCTEEQLRAEERVVKASSSLVAIVRVMEKIVK